MATCPEPAVIVDKPNSVKISQNAKGEISFEVKAYGETVDGAAESALKEFKNTQEKIQELKGQ